MFYLQENKIINVECQLNEFRGKKFLVHDGYMTYATGINIEDPQQQMYQCHYYDINPAILYMGHKEYDVEYNGIKWMIMAFSTIFLLLV